MRAVLIAVIGILLVNGLLLVPSRTHGEGLRIDLHGHKAYWADLNAREAQGVSAVPVYCADFIKHYDWNHDVAYNVMMIESRNNARNLNDNAATGDYSVGCFQINLLGGNQTAKYNLAKSLGYEGQNNREELREWLWNPANNTKVAYTMWKGQSWKPWSATTCKKVACY